MNTFSKWQGNWQGNQPKYQPQGKGFTLPECHTGNCLILDWGNGAGLYAGGWTRNANPGEDWGVIDLSEFHRPNMYTGSKQADKYFSHTLQGNQERSKGITLHLPIRDYATPHFGMRTWVNLANDVQGMLDKGINVLVACDGGHGRTGLTIAILATLLNKDGCTLPDPIAWVRKVYCMEAIETTGQELYVYDILGIDPPRLSIVDNPVENALDTTPLVDDIPEEWQGDYTKAECQYCGAYLILNEYDICEECMEWLHDQGITPQTGL